MDSKMQAILTTHFAVGQKYQKPYVTTSQEHILRLMEKYQRVKMSRSTLCRRNKKLRDEGYIRQQQRGRRGNDGKFMPGSTITHLLAKAFDWAFSSMRRFAKIFSVFRVSKLTQYRLKAARYPVDVNNLAGLINQAFRKRMPSAVFRTA